jgi:hypothetical protein
MSISLVKQKDGAMSSTLLGAQVPEVFLRAVRVVVAERGKNVSDFLREVVSRELGFSSFVEAVHFANQRYGDNNEQTVPPIVDLSEGALTPFPTPDWERAPEYDLRFERGDDYAADGWRHTPSGRIVRTVVGSGAPTADSEDSIVEALYPPSNPHVNILRDTPLMQLIEQGDLPEAHPLDETEEVHDH